MNFNGRFGAVGEIQRGPWPATTLRVWPAWLIPPSLGRLKASFGYFRTDIGD